MQENASQQNHLDDASAPLPDTDPISLRSQLPNVNVNTHVAGITTPQADHIAPTHDKVGHGRGRAVGGRRGASGAPVLKCKDPEPEAASAPPDLDIAGPKPKKPRLQ